MSGERYGGLKHIVDVPQDERKAAVRAKVLAYLEKQHNEFMDYLVKDAESDGTSKAEPTYWDHSWDERLEIVWMGLTTRKGYRGAAKYRWAMPASFGGSQYGTATVIIGPTDILSVRVYEWKSDLWTTKTSQRTSRSLPGQR